MSDDNLKCDHCGKKLETSLALIARLLKDGKLRHDFCSLKCLRLWIQSEESPVTEVLKEKQETAKVTPPKRIVMSEPTPAKLAKAMGLTTFMVVRELMDRNCFASANTNIFLSDAAAVCKKYGFKFAEEVTA